MTEANKLEIPVVGTGDTNVDPDELDYIIPANDDAIRAIRLLCTLVADAAIEGARERSARSATEPEQIEAMAMPEAEEEEVPGATDELVAALAGGAALSFEPDADDDDLLPGDRVARAEAAVAEAPRRGSARGDRRRARPRGGREERRRAGAPARRPDRTAGRGPARTRRHPSAGEPERPPRDRRTNRHGGHLGGARQGAARADRRRVSWTASAR